MSIHTKKDIVTNFYEFNQNNSGGKFVGDYYKIYIEAETPQEANKIAQDEFNVYFDGCRNGKDCSCCGDRWHKVDDYNSFDFNDYVDELLEEDKTAQMLIDLKTQFVQDYEIDRRLDDKGYDYIVLEYNKENGTNYNLEEFLRNVSVYWGMKCCIYTKDENLIEFDGYGIIYNNGE